MKSELLLSKLISVLPANVQDAIGESDLGQLVLGPKTPVLRKAASADPEALDAGERAAIRYVSTRDIDRDDEIMLPGGAMLDQFRLAPQVLWGHNYSEPPIGSDEWIKADDYGLKAKTVYASTERAEEVWTLVKEGHLKTSSVGFIPLKAIRAEDGDWKPTIETLSQKWGVPTSHFKGVSRIHTKWLLLEHSDVSVPSNIHALTLAVSKGLNLSEDMLKELGVEIWPEEKPYPNEHACRLRDPGDFQDGSFRRTTRDHEGKTYSIIMGKLKGESTMTEQAYRYGKDTWPADQARAHCKSHQGISFEPASGGRSVCIPCQEKATKPIQIRNIGQVMPVGVRPLNIEEIVFEAIETARGRV